MGNQLFATALAANSGIELKLGTNAVCFNAASLEVNSTSTIGTVEDGLYAVSYEALIAATKSSKMTLSSTAGDVVFWVANPDATNVAIDRGCFFARLSGQVSCNTTNYRTSNTLISLIKVGGV